MDENQTNDNEPTLDEIIEKMITDDNNVVTEKQSACQKECANYIDDTFANANCTGCTLNPFYMNCFAPKDYL